MRGVAVTGVVVTRVVVVRCGGGFRVRFAVLVIGKGDAARNQADTAQHGERRDGHLVGAECLFGHDFAGKGVFRRSGYGVTGEAAVGLDANQRALALTEVVFDDEIGTAAVEGDDEVAALLRGGDALRPEAGRVIGELVVNAVLRLDVQRAAAGIKVVTRDRLAAGLFVQGEGDFCHVTVLFVVCSEVPAASLRQALFLASWGAVR